MEVVSVSMTEALLDRIDGFADEHGYAGRSEVMREAARGLLDEFDDDRLADRTLMSTVSALFEYDSPRVETRMRRLRHEYDDLLSSTTHDCVGEKHGCMESFVLEGDLEEISSFVGKLRAVDEALTVDYTLFPIEDIDERPVQGR